jgi:hypothetical protein
VRVGSRVVQLPDLGVADARVFGHRVHPRVLDRLPGLDRAKDRFDRTFNLAAFVVLPGRGLLDEPECPGPYRRRQRGDRWQPEELRWCRRVGGGGGDDAELHDLAGGVRIGDREVIAGLPAPERFIRPHIPEDVVPDRDVREVDDHVGALGEPHQDPVVVVRGDVHRGSEEAALIADLPDLDAADLVEVEDQESRLAAIEEPEPVAPLLDDLEWPGVAVDHDGVAEELGVPDRREALHPTFRDERPDEAVEVGPSVRVEQRSVIVEGAVLDRDRDLVVGLVGRELVIRLRGGAGQDGRAAVARVEGDVIRSTANEIETGRTRIDVEPGHAQRVVVIPGGRSTIGIRVLERGEARPPGRAVVGLRLAREEVVPGPIRCVAGRDVSGSRQVPRLRIAVALVADTDGTVDMGDHRDRAGVRAWRRLKGRTRVTPVHPAGRVRPVERRIDRKEMRQVIPVRVDQVVDPPDPDRPLPLRLDGERRGVVQ